jgi:hypothetical protein
MPDSPPDPPRWPAQPEESSPPANASPNTLERSSRFAKSLQPQIEVTPKQNRRVIKQSFGRVFHVPRRGIRTIDDQPRASALEAFRERRFSHDGLDPRGAHRLHRRVGRRDRGAARERCRPARRGNLRRIASDPRRGGDCAGPAPAGLTPRYNAFAGSTWVLRSSGAASGEVMNLIIARAASGSFELATRATLDGHGTFREPGSGPT